MRVSSCVRGFWSLAVFLLAVALPLRQGGAEGVERAFPLEAKRILFLGDSITHAGQYVALIETQLRLQGLKPLPELINLGLSSETCTGLSEPGHPFPRPDVHRRLDRALAVVKPDVVVACYGMNDGIYHPFGAERFQQYREGIGRLSEQVHAAGAKLILMTPPPFDSLPVKQAGKLVPAGAEQYAYFAVYENYDEEVVQRYGQWLLGRDESVEPPQAEMVIDLHRPIRKFVAEQRQEDPKFTAAPDGVHPNAEGHRLIAETVLKAWGIESWREPPEELLTLMMRRERLLHAAWLSHVGHERPGVAPGLPLEQAQQQADELVVEIERLVQATQQAAAARRESLGGER